MTDLYVIPIIKSMTPSFSVSILQDFDAFCPIEVPHAAVAVPPFMEELKTLMLHLLS